MNREHLLVATLLILPFQAQASVKTEVLLQKYGVDSERLSELLNKDYSDWQALTPKDKELAVKGTIINLDLGSSENTSVFEGHAQASIQCMDTKGHGLKLPPSEDLRLPLVRCITDTYEAYQQKSPAK